MDGSSGYIQFLTNPLFFFIFPPLFQTPSVRIKSDSLTKNSPTYPSITTRSQARLTTIINIVWLPVKKVRKQKNHFSTLLRTRGVDPPSFAKGLPSLPPPLQPIQLFLRQSHYKSPRKRLKNGYKQKMNINKYLK